MVDGSVLRGSVSTQTCGDTHHLGCSTSVEGKHTAGPHRQPDDRFTLGQPAPRPSDYQEAPEKAVREQDTPQTGEEKESCKKEESRQKKESREKKEGGKKTAARQSNARYRCWCRGAVDQKVGENDRKYQSA